MILDVCLFVKLKLLECMRVWGILVGFLHISLGRLEAT
jgi:hypothetical protein